MPMIASSVPNSSRIESRPGKFQGEPIYVQAFWRAALHGLADWEGFAHNSDELVSVFVLTLDDMTDHPGLTGVYALAVWEDSAGFVNHAALTRDEHEAFIGTVDSTNDSDEH